MQDEQASIECPRCEVPITYSPSMSRPQTVVCTQCGDQVLVPAPRNSPAPPPAVDAQRSSHRTDRARTHHCFKCYAPFATYGALIDHERDKHSRRTPSSPPAADEAVDTDTDSATDVLTANNADSLSFLAAGGDSDAAESSPDEAARDSDSDGDYKYKSKRTRQKKKDEKTKRARGGVRGPRRTASLRVPRYAQTSKAGEPSVPCTYCDAMFASTAAKFVHEKKAH